MVFSDVPCPRRMVDKNLYTSNRTTSPCHHWTLSMSPVSRGENRPFLKCFNWDMPGKGQLAKTLGR